MATNRSLEEKLTQKDEKVLSQQIPVIKEYIDVDHDWNHDVEYDENFISSSSHNPYFWREIADESINKHNNNSENKDRQKQRFVERFPEETYRADPERYAIELQKVAGYIRGDLDSSANIHKICEAQRVALEKEKLLGRSVAKDEAGKNIIMIAGKKYRLREREEERPAYAMDTLRESYIEAVATSILAETDGESAVAKEVLENGGMEVVKNLDENSIADLLVDLQIIALEGEEIQVNLNEREEGGMSR